MAFGVCHSAFIFDVGVRRIQIDRDEMLRAMRYVQRKVFAP